MPPALPAAVAGAVAGGAVLLAYRRRRRFRRSLDEPPVSPELDADAGIPVSGGFAEAEFERAFAHRVRSGEVEPAVLVADLALRFLREQGVDAVVPVAVSQGRCSTGLTADLTLRASLADQPRLVALAPQLGARLGGAGEALGTADHDVVLRLSALKPVRLMVALGAASHRPRGAAAPGAGGGEIVDEDDLRRAHTAPVRPIWLPLGLTQSGAVVYVNWRELGHTLLAGAAGGGAEVVLTSLVAALAARCHPGSLQLAIIGGRRTLPDALLGFPHLMLRPGDPVLAASAAPVAEVNRPAAAAELLRDLHGELLRRMRHAGHGTGADHLPALVGTAVSDGDGLPHEPDIVVIASELVDLDDDDAADALEALAAHGAPHGIHLLAATARPDAVGDHLLRHFATRLIFQTPTEEDSILLLGRPDAADLGGGGNLLARIAGRASIRLRGFRIAPERLDQLVRSMREAFGSHGADGASILASAAEVEDGRRRVRPIQRVVPVRDGRFETEEPEGCVDGTAVPPEGFRCEPAARPTAMADLDAGDKGPAIELVAGAAGAVTPSGYPPPALAASEKGERADTADTAAARPPGSPAMVAEAVSKHDEHDEHHGTAVSTQNGALLDAPGGHLSECADRLIPSPQNRQVSRSQSDANGHGTSAAPPTTRVYVRCLGDLEVLSEGQPIDVEGEDRTYYQQREILAFMACQPGPTTRERLLNAFWPEVEYERAAKRLTVALVRLRQWLTEKVPGLSRTESLIVRCDRDGTCSLDTAVVSSDAQEFLVLVRT
ncbi:MAG: AfsR/SARP family transcriptional regulator, partial [Chloroflexota bacterium]